MSGVFKDFGYICKFLKAFIRTGVLQQFYSQTFTRNKGFSSFPFQILYEEYRFQSFLLHLYFCFQSFDEGQKFQFSFKSFEDDLRFQSFLLYFLFQSIIRTTTFIIVKAFTRSRVFTVFWYTCIFLFKGLIKVMSGTSKLARFIWSEKCFFQSRKNAFCFTSKASFTQEMLNILFRFFPLSAFLLGI